MTDKKPWLEEALGRGIRVLVFNGNLDIIVNVAGTNRMINSLQWSGKKEFANSKRDVIWVWNEDTGRGEMSGYANDGGGLTYAVIRNAGKLPCPSQTPSFQIVGGREAGYESINNIKIISRTV